MFCHFISLNDGAKQHHFCIYESDIKIVEDGEAITFQGTKAIAVGDLEVTAGVPDHRGNFQLALVDPDDIRYFTTDPGIVAMEIGFLVSDDYGVTWRKLTRKVSGSLSGAEIKDGIISSELETLKGDVAHEGLDVWSDEAQKAEFDGDEGMGYVRPIAAGEVEIAWPR